ncbi:MAG: cytochrome c biogenesis protein CcsA [Algoriphagus sp.]|nr:cytochrome c biogenesis protein CcsA [Algoriphagus sp.]
MNRVLSILSKISGRLFNTSAAGFFILVFAISIGAATFIENDYGTSAAQKLVYKALWFEILLALFSVTLVVNVIRYRMLQQKKWANFLFHVAMVIIILGAGITRYFSYEGVMGIREGGTSNFIYSSDSYLNFEAKADGQDFMFAEPLLISSLGSNEFDKEYLIGNELIRVQLKNMIPNPVQRIAESDEMNPIIKVVFGGGNGRMEYFIRYGEQRMINGVYFNFSDSELSDAFNIYYQGGGLKIKTNTRVSETVMRDRSESVLEPFIEYPLKLNSLYNNGVGQFVFGDFSQSGNVVLEPGAIKLERSSLVGLELLVSIGGETFERTIFGSQGNVGKREVFSSNGVSLAISYGSKEIQLPFSLALQDFIMERYPGTNSPASFASEVTLIDPRSGLQEDHRIYMNHVLDYDGFRFFQSSYDRDELGTYLSVNHDFWGTIITYIGYGLLTLGMILIFFTKHTRFTQLSENLRKIRAGKVILLIILFGGLVTANPVLAQERVKPAYEVVAAQHAELFSQVIVQDFRGRMKPMHTLTRELLRKVSGKDSFEEFTADQVILSMYVQNKQWYAVPLIKLGKHENIPLLIGVEPNSLASYKDFFNVDGSYKLRDELIRANNINPAERGAFEKQLISVDERVNVLNIIFSGSFMRVIPLENDANNTWISERFSQSSGMDLMVAKKFFGTYKEVLHDAMHNGAYSVPNQMLNDLIKYQKKVGSAVAPSDLQIGAEVLLNNSKVFNRLAVYNSLLGLTYLILLFTTVFKPSWNLQKVLKGLAILVFFGFVFHTVGLGLRWFVSGRAPWSNGYESMIYIAWTASLAGLIFTRKSPGGMAATLVLSGTVLLIAMLSYLDPEITPLVPVLKSYWLTIHVSLEAGSYGFLMLGAIVGLINLSLFLVLNPRNKVRIKRIVQEMTYISEMTLIGGIVMLSVGTYLGGVWANESWGRYWGWDAKETWALVSILVYAFILHMRLIPGLKGLFAFNFATLFGLSSVIMTYFGVNYYLSGLHSYAAGDPVPIPDWVYISVIMLLIISIGAYFKYRKYKITDL